MPHIIYPFIKYTRLTCFQFWRICIIILLWPYAYRFLCGHLFHSLGCGVELLHYKFMFNVCRKFQPIFQSDYVILYFHQLFYHQSIWFLWSMICDFHCISPAFILLNLFLNILLSVILMWIEFFLNFISNLSFAIIKYAMATFFIIVSYLMALMYSVIYLLVSSLEFPIYKVMPFF